MMDQEKVNILLVDDQPAKLLAYEVILKELGENLVKASSGREALEFLLKNDVAIILVDVRRLQDSFAAVDFFEARKLPFVIGVNEFDGAPRYPAQEVRKALALPDHIPVVLVDARDRHSARASLIAVTEYALTNLSTAS